ncbi:MAG: hypothetical protein IKY33_01175 [Clostridia bacterium]|nr:hypothetical protein [Clostridia bacterium]
MKRVLPLLLILLVLLSACKPAEDREIRIGSEDGGGSGYGTDIKSVLELSDFYSVTSGSMRDNNLLMLGTPFFVLGESDTYTLSDGSQVVLTYDAKGILEDTLYTEFETGLSYSLFDKLTQLGVLRGSQSDVETEPPADGSGETVTPPTGQGGSGGIVLFSDRTYKLSEFEGRLSLYLDRSTILSTFGFPNYYRGRTYQKDSYIIDCYVLDDGSIMLLDYGYNRINLRGAALQEAGGVTRKYLGSWSVQSKPADFIRPRVELSSVTALKKGTTAKDVYRALGEPAWFEGNASKYREAYVLPDGNIIYLTYDDGHKTLTSAYRQTAEGQLLEVTLR